MQDPLRDAIRRFADGEPLLDSGRTVLRIGLAFVFVWFGVDKFLHTSYWPMWVPDALGFLAGPAGIWAIGLWEVAIGVLLLAGRRERAVALVASLHLGAVVVSQGATLVAVRDVGLLAAALTVGLTAPGGAPIRRPTWNVPRIPSPLRSGRLRTGLAVLVLIAGTVAGGALAVGWATGGEDETGNAGPLLAFADPTDEASVPGGDLPIMVALDPRVHELGLDHVHIKVDERVVDALYFQDDDANVTTTIHVDPGRRTIGAYLAYIDHVEHEDSWTEIQVDVR